MAGLNVGVVVGRFQVSALHEAHVALLNHVMHKSDAMVVLIGVSPIDGYAPEYPLTYAQRVEVVRDFVGGNAVILPIMDMPTNAAWSTQLDALLRGLFPTDTITLYGGRDSFIPKYTGRLVTCGFEPLPSLEVSGSMVRAATQLETGRSFMRGQIFALNHHYPKVYPTVDIAHVRGERIGCVEVLLIQRADTGIWCFPGGFVDPTDGNYEHAAKRELYEEVGLLSEAPLDYIGSAYIHDWRYRGSRDKIMTTFFLSHHTSGFAKLNPEEVTEARYVPVSDVAGMVANAHRPLATMLTTFLKG